MLSGSLPTVDNATCCRKRWSSLLLDYNILLLPMCQMSLNSLMSLKIIFELYHTDFWQGQFPEAVEIRDCLTCCYAGREVKAGLGTSVSRDGTLHWSHALLSSRESWKPTHRNQFPNTLKLVFPSKGGSYSSALACSSQPPLLPLPCQNKHFNIYVVNQIWEWARRCF